MISESLARRDRARSVAGAALMEVGFSDHISTMSMQVPPQLAWKAWCLGRQATDRDTCTFEEWPQWMIDNMFSGWWESYFDHHGLTPEPE